MSISLIPGPGAAEPDKNGHEQAQGGDRRDAAGADRDHHHQGRPGKSTIPSPDDCARAIAQLAGLVAMGMLKPAQANAIRAAFRDILHHHRTKAKEADKSVSNADVMDLLRHDPKLLNLLAPLLTSEQLDMVMSAGREDADGQT
jgi:hypothetical protein